MTEQPSLLPCPFCGSTDVVAHGDDKIVGVSCNNCEAHGPNQYGSFEWNTRANLAPTVKPLAWEWAENGYCWAADEGFYKITKLTPPVHGMPKGKPYCLMSPGRDNDWHATLEEAKAAAQADYERRVLSALTTALVTPQQQARFVIDYLERETGVDFGDFIGMADKERIKAIAGEPTNDQ